MVLPLGKNPAKPRRILSYFFTLRLWDPGFELREAFQIKKWQNFRPGPTHKQNLETFGYVLKNDFWSPLDFGTITYWSRVFWYNSRGFSLVESFLRTWDLAMAIASAFS